MFLNNNYINLEHVERLTINNIDFSEIVDRSINSDGTVDVLGKVEATVEVELSTGTTFETTVNLGNKSVHYSIESAEQLFRNPKKNENLQPARVYLKYLRKVAEQGIYERKVEIAKQKLEELFDESAIVFDSDSVCYKEVITSILEGEVLYCDSKNLVTADNVPVVENEPIFGNPQEASEVIQPSSLMEEPVCNEDSQVIENESSINPESAF